MDGWLNGEKAGGIFWLSQLAVQHRAELAADFRAIYNVSASDVCGAELWDLILQLLKDPSSRLHAASVKWEYPIERNAIYTLDLLDLFLMRYSEKGKFKPVPRPWDKANKPRTKSTLNAAQAHRRLRPHLYEN